jgi:isopentenyldiphosphate isomerase/intracellular septation protein A
MNKIEILKKMLPGLLPLFVFIIADAFFGTEIGLITAVIFGFLQLLYSYIKFKKIDKFVLFDTLLIIAMGAVSLFLHNDVFFKLKPAIINLILCGVLGISAFSSKNIIAKMTAHYVKDIKLNPTQLRQLQKSARNLFFLFVFHSILIVYSALYMSKEAWVFISGVLFYILFAAYFLVEFVKNKFRLFHYKKQEWLPVLDEKGNITGKATRKECHKNKELLHPVVHLHIINKEKEIFLQKRPDWKTIQPGKWDTAVGGHVSWGEDVESALKREALEELNLQDFTIIPLAKYIWESEVEREMVFTYLTYYNAAIEVNTKEVETGRFFPISEIKKNIGKQLFTPNFEKEFQLLEEWFKKNG